MARRKGRMETGRPDKLTPSVVEDVETYLMLGATHEIAAKAAGISIDTFYKWRRDARELLARLQAEEDKYEQRQIEIAIAEDEGLDPPEPYEPDLSITNFEARKIKFFKVTDEAEAMGAIEHLNYLRQVAPHDPDTSKWILGHRYGYGRPKQIEISGPGGGPIEQETTADVDVDALANRLTQILHQAQLRKQGEQDDDGADSE